MRKLLKKKTYLPLRNAAIMSVYSVAGISLALAAPNALQLLKGFEPDPRRKKEMSRTFSRLIDRGYLFAHDTGAHRALELTPKGKLIVEKLLYGEVTLKRRRGWDRKWRIIAFDIPESLRAKRDILRNALKRLGFLKLQQSVWVYPHDCVEILILIRKDLSLYGYVLYIVADTIEREHTIARHFRLEHYL